MKRETSNTALGVGLLSAWVGIIGLSMGVAFAQDAGVKKWNPKTVSGEIAEGGNLLILEHVAANESDAMESCEDGSHLDDTERSAAETIGNAFRQAGITVNRLLASERCVARETARLLDLGEVQVDPNLNPVAIDSTDAGDVARLRNMLEFPTTPDSNVLLVSHGDNVNRLLKTDVDSPAGTLHVLRTTDGSVSYVGTIAPSDWPASE